MLTPNEKDYIFFESNTGLTINDFSLIIYDEEGNQISNGSNGDFVEFDTGLYKVDVKIDEGEYVFKISHPDLDNIYTTDIVKTPYDGLTQEQHNALINMKKATLNRTKIDENYNILTIYDDDGTTELFKFDLKDRLGNASVNEVFERVPK